MWSVKYFKSNYIITDITLRGRKLLIIHKGMLIFPEVLRSCKIPVNLKIPVASEFKTPLNLEIQETLRFTRG